MTADGLPTAQINGVVTTQVIAGTTVYAGGEFTSARPAGAAPGTQTVPRYNLLSYDITTGVLNAFAPQFNGKVKALALRTDKRVLYVGGNFTKVGAAHPEQFRGLHRLHRQPAPDRTERQRRGERHRGDREERLPGRQLQHSQRGEPDPAGGDQHGHASWPVTAWEPTADDDVLALTATPDQDQDHRRRVVPQGQRQQWLRLVALDATTGVRKTWLINQVVRDYGETAAILSLTADTDTVYGSGYAFGGPSGNFEGAFAARTRRTAK